MKKLLTFLSRYYPVFILFAVECAIVVANFKQGTFFLGWDNLFPEMNFGANFQRSLFSVWQEYRGLGLMDGMSFAANLPHYIFTYLLSFVFPLSIIRYFVFFTLHVFGGIGVYLLSQELFRQESKTKPVSLIGSLFYMLNFGTVQMFFAPYEVFAFHFAFLPLLLLSVMLFLKNGTKRAFTLFVLVSFLAIPQAHVPTLFIVYAIALFTILCIFFFYTRWDGVKRIGIVLVLTLFINAFWGLPYAVSAVKNAKTIASAKINQMATEDIYLKNKGYGTFSNVALLKGFSLDFIDTQMVGDNDYMMKNWRGFTSTPLFQVIGYGFFVVAILGLIDIIVYRKRAYYPFAILFVFSFLMLGTDIPVLSGVSAFFNTYVPYFFQIFRFTFTKFSLLYVFAFSILITVGCEGVFHIVGKNKKVAHVGCVGLLVVFVLYSLPIWQGDFLYKNLKVQIPNSYFELVRFLKTQDKNTRIATLPQPSYWGWTYTNWGYRGSGFLWYGIPQSTLDGAFYPWSRENENYYWEITNAIYSSQPRLLDAVIDKYQIRWMIVDMSTSSVTPMRSLYIDKLVSLINQSSKYQLEKKFDNILLFRTDLKSSMNSYVYLKNDLPAINSSEWNNYDKGYEEYGDYVSDNSPRFGEAGRQQITDNKEPTTYNLPPTTIYYPFRSLFTGRKQEELEFQVSDAGDAFVFTSHAPTYLRGAFLHIPPVSDDESSELNMDRNGVRIKKYPIIFLDGRQIDVSAQSSEANTQTKLVQIPDDFQGLIEVRVPKVAGYYSVDTGSIMKSQSKKNPVSCDQFNQGKTALSFIDSDHVVRFESMGGSNCMDFYAENLSQKIGYIISVQNRNVEGKSLLFSLINKTSQRADLETYLPMQTTNNRQQITNTNEPTTYNLQPTTSYFVIPPMEEFGLGYALHFDNISIGRVRTINDLGRITVNPIPYRFLTGLKIVKENVNLKPTTYNLQLTKVDHPNPSYYQITYNIEHKTNGSDPTTENLPPTTLILSQSYDNGWHAYEIGCQMSDAKCQMAKMFPFLFGRELKDHVLVNNWENGWNIGRELVENGNIVKNGQKLIQPISTTIVIVYLPQYLEYIGFILLLGMILGLIFPFRKTSYSYFKVVNLRHGRKSEHIQEITGTRNQNLQTH